MLLYKIRKAKVDQVNGRVTDAFSITVPQHIAAFVPGDVKFFPELTPQGILFKAIRDEKIEMPENAPEWMNPEIEATLTEDERRGI